MPLTFMPKTEEELKVMLLTKGEYDFEVLSAEEQTSKQGNDMIKLTLRVHGPNGETVTVYDYLLSSMEFKLKHFCDTAGLINEYQSGMLSAEMCINKYGRCKLDIKTDKTGKYEDRNEVKDYVGQAVNAADIAAGDVPF